MSRITFPTGSDITIEVNGQQLAVAQSYKARTTKESRYVEAFGSREPVGAVDGRVKHVLELTRVCATGAALRDKVDFYSLSDFNVVVARPGRKIIYSGCQWSDIAEAASAERALELLGAEQDGFDVALLDVMLPGMNGFSLCETIRRDSAEVGIIILSAKTQEKDKINGLSIGADDYITKPFSVSELLARVEALCRRVTRQATERQGESRLVSGQFVLDQKSRVLYKNGQPIDLTQVEFQIMELFFQNPGVALVRDKILEGVWGKNYYGDVKIVDVNIRRLRMKIEDEPSSPTHIATVWGYGYRWKP